MVVSARSTRKPSAERPSRTQWARLRQLQDREIDYSDSPSTTPEFWAPAILIHPSRKVPVSLRLDEDVLAWFKSQGARYQTRINAVLRAYVERHASEGGGARERAATYKGALLADLEAARERYEALENLRATIKPRIFDYVERRIQATGDGPHTLKLPVLFFFLVRRDPRELRQFDEFLGRLRRSHRKRDLPNLLDRLRSEEEYRQAVSAIFEVEVLRTLLDAAPAGSVSLYPRIGKTPNHADAALRLGRKTVYVEVKLISQDAKQERVQDIGIASALGHPTPSQAEMDELGLHRVSEGVVGGWGDPYGDALRVMGKLTEKPAQWHPEAPNVICLGLSDLHPDVTTVEWALNAVYSGSTTIPHVVADRTRDAGKIETLERLVRDAKPEPRLTGVLVFDVKGSQAYPIRAFQNRASNSSNSLESQEWNALLALFGFPQDPAGSGSPTSQETRTR